MAVEARFVADGTQREGWTTLAQAPGETNQQVFDRKQASHERLGWVVSRTGNTMTAVKDYPHNDPPFPRRKERFFRVRN